MSAEKVFTGFRCYCAHCMGQGEDASVSAKPTYYIPDPPRIPPPPGSTVLEKPPEEDLGFKGPRQLTLVRGDDWNGALVGTPVLVPYTFATRSMHNYGTGVGGFELTSGEPLDAAQRASIREALGLWEQVSGLTFIEVPDTADWNFAGIRFMMESLEYLVDADGVLDLAGYTFFPQGASHGFNIAFNRVHYADHPLQRGSEAFWTVLHEIGHAIGLKHPFQDGLVLSKSEDNNKNTVMSYTDKGNHSNLGPFDIAAAQYLYGTPEAEAAAPIRWARGGAGELVTVGDGTPNRIGGLDIRDVVFGDGGGDLIATRGGDDLVLPGAGDDAVFGGGGFDTLVTGALRRQASVVLGDQRGTVALPDGFDTFYEVEVLRFVDGDLLLQPHEGAGQVHRLYGAALGRAPDAVGLGGWVEALQSGAITLPEAAARFYTSAEFAARYGAPNAVGFVTLLYQNVLGRAPDAAGLDFWVNAVLNPAINHVGVLLGFSESAEYRARTAGAFDGGMWVANPEAVDALRAYVAVLDRLPEAAGLAGWTAAREAGLSSPEMVHRFVASDEFQARFGHLSNRDFVEQLYRTSLDRAADPDGAAAWTHVLDAGIDSRAGVALGFAGSAEMTAKLTPLVSDGVLFA